MSNYTPDTETSFDTNDEPIMSAADDAALQVHADETDAQAAVDAETPLLDNLFTDYTIVYAGRTFVIGKPTIQTIMRIANLIGALGLRSNKRVATFLSDAYGSVSKQGKREINVPNTALFFGLAAVMLETDLITLSSALLFGGTDEQMKQGKAFHEGLGDNMELDPVIKAFAYRLHQSDDLRAALGNLPLIGAAMPKNL